MWRGSWSASTTPTSTLRTLTVTQWCCSCCSRTSSRSCASVSLTRSFPTTSASASTTCREKEHGETVKGPHSIVAAHPRAGAVPTQLVMQFIKETQERTGNTKVGTPALRSFTCSIFGTALESPPLLLA